MIDAVDDGIALGCETCQHQARGCAQVGRNDRRGCQLGNAGANGRVAVELNIRAHPLQFENVLETILENGLGNRADPVRDGVHRTELRLHVGRKGRERRGSNIDG